jgi:photosystem II stability/assembly factor-like uncharacterized protein
MGRLASYSFILMFCLLLPALSLAEDARLLPLASKSLLLDIVSIDDELVVVGEYGHILLSHDNGESWQQAQVPSRQMLTAVHFSTPSRGWAVGHDGLILASVDGGEHWVVQRDGLQEQKLLNALKLASLQSRREELRGSLLAAESRGQRSELQLTLEDLELDIEDAQYQLQDAVHAPPLLDVFFRDELRGIAVGAFNTLLLTTDGGVSWRYLSDRLENPDEYHLNAVTGDSDGNLWIAGEGGVLFHSADAGENWRTLASPYAGSWFGIDLALQSGRLLVFGLRGNVFFSDDGGDSWLGSAVATDRSLAGGGFLNERYVMLVGAVGTLLVSEDGGASFSSRPLGERVNLSAVACAGGQALVVGQGGVYRAAGVGGRL